MRTVSALACLAVCVGACQTLASDPPAPYDASPLGTGLRIADIQNPSSASYQYAIANPAKGALVNVSSVVVSWIDTFDETKDGKSRGTVYIQDVGSAAPYSGISVFEASYVPASLRLLPGDVLDFSGPYQEVTSIGTAIFNAGTTLPQLAKPVGDFRYEFRTPDPVPIELSDLNELTYATGRKWEGMLVTIHDVSVAAGVSASNRVTYLMGQADGSFDLNNAAISNELYNLGATDFPAGTHFSSVTGIVTWFYSFQLAPRSAADLVQ
jgi:hypothetical protein